MCFLDSVPESQRVTDRLLLFITQTAEQMSMVAEVQRRTNLITNWAADLSMAANFDLAAAGVKFGEMRVS